LCLHCQVKASFSRRKSLCQIRPTRVQHSSWKDANGHRWSCILGHDIDFFDCIIAQGQTSSRC
jgi:hypothetical protein